MTFPRNYFGAHVLQAPAIGVSFLLNDLRKAEISNAKMAFKVYHNILRFKIPVYDALRVQVLDCQ